MKNYIFQVVKNRLNNLKNFYLINIKRDEFLINLNRWFADHGDQTLRLDYPLNKNSVVFDVGGYIGDWSYEIDKRYTPYIYIFEPATESYTKIKNRFESNNKIKVFNFGLFDSDFDAPIFLSKTSSSIYRKFNNWQNAKFRDIYNFINENQIETIDLIKINIEGGEYPLLKRMIDTKIVEKCYDIQVQFHTFYPRAKQLRNEIRKSLQKTHLITYDYPFVWENWRRISKSKIEQDKKLKGVQY